MNKRSRIVKLLIRINDVRNKKELVIIQIILRCTMITILCHMWIWQTFLLQLGHNNGICFVSDS